MFASPFRFPVDEPAQGFGLVDAFPGIEFQHPIAIKAPPGNSNALVIAERFGRIHVLQDLSNPVKRTFLNLAGSTISDGGLESGLLGLEFHPQFHSNGYFFVYRVLTLADGYYNRLSRFRADPATLEVLPGSEEIILQQRDLRYIQHNAGDIRFGPDGYLYLALGEATPPEEDFRLTRQPIDKNFFGVILRIDVDKRPGNLPPNPHPGVFDRYLVPNDNPFVGATEYQGIPLNTATLRTEIFALGFRNPWRICFDPESGELFCGDVGEQTYEEVNLIRPGGNYGWPYLEGPQPMPFYPARPSGFASEAPLWTYLHNSTPFGGQAIIGGEVYMGHALPGLRRAYVFGDNVRGHIWALRRGPLHGTNEVRWLTGEPSLSTFGIDPRDNELLVASLLTGRIRKLVYREPAQAALPEHLSQTGLFADTATLTPAADVVPYTINVPFWSDHARKQRWFWLPPNESLTFEPDGSISAPAGTVWIKHFELETSRGDASTRRRLETRLLIKGSSVYGLTYKWNAAETDATLVPSEGADETIAITENGQTRAQTWRYPSRLECRACHNPLVGDALGFSGAQLNCPDPATSENQLAAFVRDGILQNYDTNSPPQPLAAAKDERFSLEHRVRSYMQANCAQCHFPGNPIIAHWDARFETPLSRKGLDALIVPNSTANSALYRRLGVRDSYHMPPIATSESNREALDLLREWITAHPQDAWDRLSIGTPTAPGQSLIRSNFTAEVTTFPSYNGETAGEFLARSATGALHIAARLDPARLDDTARAGIRLAASGSSGLFYFAGLSTTGPFTESNAGDSSTFEDDETGARWLRVAADGEGVRFWIGQPGNWHLLETKQNAFGTNLSAGFAVTTTATSGPEPFARFEDASVLFASVRFLQEGTNRLTFEPMSIECVLSGENDSVEKVIFYANDEPIGESTADSYTIEWSATAPGSYQIAARVITEEGYSVLTHPIHLSVSAPAVEATWVAEDATTGGLWQESYGHSDYFAPDFSSPGGAVAFSLLNGTVMTDSTASPAALAFPGLGHRAQTYWGGTNVTVLVRPLDGLIYKVSLYLEGEAPQTVSLLDASTKATLIERTVIAPTGTYLSFLLKGPVQFVIRGTQAKLRGVFIDPSPHPAPAFTLGPLPDEIPAASTWIVRPTAAPGIDLAKFELYLNGEFHSSDSEEPFQLKLTDLPAGTHTVRLRATDAVGQTVDTNLALRVILARAGARFLGVDDETKGEWQNHYGNAGYLIVGGGTNLPSYASIIPTNHFFYPFAPFDSPALRSPEDGSPIHAVWTAPYEMSLRVALNDGAPRRFSIYLFDSPSIFREQLVRVIDLQSGELLDELLLKDFDQGRYYTWLIQGAVEFRIIARSGTTLFCGAFLDDLDFRPPDVVIQEPLNGASLSSSLRLAVRLGFTDPDGVAERTELYVDNRLLCEFLHKAELADLPLVPPGEHWLSAAVVDRFGGRRWSAPVQIVAPPVESRTVFVSEDSLTGGDWKTRFGSEGSMIAGDSTNLTGNAAVQIFPAPLWYWDVSPSGRESLQRLGPGRIAAAWYDPGIERSLDVCVSFADAEPRRVALYFLDYQSGSRQLVVEARHPEAGAALDVRHLAGFQDGKYLTWEVTGSVAFKIQSPNSAPVLNGLFIDGSHDYNIWQRLYFDPAQDPRLDGPESDPDEDGVPNLLEFVTGTHPWRAEPIWAYRHEESTARAVFEVVTARNRYRATPVIEASTNLLNWTPASELPHLTRTSLTQRVFEFRLPTEEAGAVYFRVGGVVSE